MSSLAGTHIAGVKRGAEAVHETRTFVTVGASALSAKMTSLSVKHAFAGVQVPTCVCACRILVTICKPLADARDT